MRIDVDGDRVLLELDREEAKRLSIALVAGYESVSRAEYFIRTGLAEATIREISALLMRQQANGGVVELPLEDGVEATENPRRPRPAG